MLMSIVYGLNGSFNMSLSLQEIIELRRAKGHSDAEVLDFFGEEI